jgi:hypothetical protein
MALPLQNVAWGRGKVPSRQTLCRGLQVEARGAFLQAMPSSVGHCHFLTLVALLSASYMSGGWLSRQLSLQWGVVLYPVHLWGTNPGSLLWTSILYYSGKSGQINSRPNKPEAILSLGPPHCLIQDPHTVRDCACRRILIKTSNSEGLAEQAGRVDSVLFLAGEARRLSQGQALPRQMWNRPALSSSFDDGVSRLGPDLTGRTGRA